ncbi:hypothetical protein [Sphingobium bisphenolivorans]|uniref:hypothetical protein n=1 Tax=Sphingobium bisphenolivorans TaxID=1335760 RepID=UPI003B75BBEA
MAASLILLATPVGLIETLVASSGLSEALPAAAPPLGWKARAILSAFGAAMALGLIWAGEDRQRVQRGAPSPQQKGRPGRASGVDIMGFALSKLGWLSRGRRGSPSARGPALRRADAHPDAPARTPIFASKDFGGLDIFTRTAAARDQADTAALAIPAIAEPAEEEGFAPLPAAQRAGQEIQAVEAEPVAPVRPSPQNLSIAELTERLERGLAERKRTGRTAAVIADMPVERPVPVRDHVEQDVDQALRAALGTLRSMAGRSR